MENEWLTVEKFWDYCRDHPVDPSMRMLLASDGTVVRLLQTLFLQPIGIEVRSQRELLMDDALADWLEIEKGEKAVERKVWLTTPPDRRNESLPKGRKRIFAISTFPISPKLPPGFYQEMQLGQKPLGRIIQERRLLTRRDRLEIRRLRDPEAAEELGLPPGDFFWARRYRLTISEQVSGAIFELFSPALFSSLS